LKHPVSRRRQFNAAPFYKNHLVVQHGLLFLYGQYFYSGVKAHLLERFLREVDPVIQLDNATKQRLEARGLNSSKLKRL